VVGIAGGCRRLVELPRHSRKVLRQSRKACLGRREASSNCGVRRASGCAPRLSLPHSEFVQPPQPLLKSGEASRKLIPSLGRGLRPRRNLAHGGLERSDATRKSGHLVRPHGLQAIRKSAQLRLGRGKPLGERGLPARMQHARKPQEHENG
jgi:hypothetical protein